MTHNQADFLGAATSAGTRSQAKREPCRGADALRLYSIRAAFLKVAPCEGGFYASGSGIHRNRWLPSARSGKAGLLTGSMIRA